MNARLLIVLTLMTSLMACDEIKQDNIRVAKQMARQKQVDDQITTRGYAEVGKTPNGHPLYMKEVELGGYYDRVYFTENSITAREVCGKLCVKSVTTVQ